MGKIFAIGGFIFMINQGIMERSQDATMLGFIFIMIGLYLGMRNQVVISKYKRKVRKREAWKERIRETPQEESVWDPWN